MQAKLHRWAVADPGRRFDDLFNFVYDPATLIAAFGRVAGNRGAATPGVDGLTVADVEEQVGVPGFLDDLRAALKDGSFRPLPVRERKIPKPGGSGKVRKLGIATVADRVVQAALKLVLEPIFEADFLPCSYGFRPRRRAHDAIAEECVRFFVRGDFRCPEPGRLSKFPYSRYLLPSCPVYAAASWNRTYHTVPAPILRVPVYAASYVIPAPAA